ncbi:MAG: hypothetical protein RIQ81_189 [Pseudomonadota bacterium]
MSGIEATRRTHRILFSVAFSALLAVSTPVFAFTLLGGIQEVTGWKDKNIAFHLDPTGCPPNITSLITKARAVWNAVPDAGVTLDAGPETSATVASISDGTAGDIPAIVCVTDMAAIGLNGNVIAGIAFGQRFDSKGALNYGGLAINADASTTANIAAIDEGTAIAVMAHEIGHVLGIGHSTEKKALMYYDGSKRKSATLHQDDVDALVYLYPRNEFDGDDLLGGCAMISNPSGKKIQIGSWLLLWPMFLLLFRRSKTLALRISGHRQL